MSIQVIWIIIATVGALIAGKTIALNWDKIKIALEGKRIAILGAREVGKTHLIRFLTTGSIPSEYKQTVAPEKASARRFDLKKLDLKIKDTLDIPGDQAAYAEWKELFDKAELVFYLLRADRLLRGDLEVEARVRADMRHIGDWLNARQMRPKFFIIGTFCDLDPDFAKITPGKMGDYVDKFRHLPIISELVARGGGARQTKVFLGSMKTRVDTEALVFQVFSQVIL